MAAGAGPGGAPVVGVIVSLGGQTPLKLAHAIDPALVLGHQPGLDRPGRGPRAVERPVRAPGHPPAAGGHGRHRRGGADGGPQGRLPRPGATELRARRPGHGDRLRRRTARTRSIGELGASLARREGGVSAERPVLVDRFLEDAIEVDVDAVRDRTGEVLIAGVMEHVEEAGVHSGDSACALPPPDAVRRRHRRARRTHPRHRRCACRRRPAERPVRREGGSRSSSSRPTRAPAGRCPSWPRPPASPWPRSPPGS